MHKIKLSLRYLQPPIWRRLLVPSDTTLAELHHIIQDAMGWENCHLHQFEVGDVSYTDPAHDPLDESQDEAQTTLAGLKAGDHFVYWYDFGDDWFHDILVESVDQADPSVSYPRCVAGARACPPEDCGGPGGFDGLLQALADVKHPEYEEYRDWLEDMGAADYDPAHFDLNKVNRVLASRAARSGRR